MVDLAVRGEAEQSASMNRGPMWDAWESLEVPPGCRAEILRGKIVVSPAPTNKHNLIQYLLHEMLYPALKNKAWLGLNELAVYIAANDEVLIPDFTVIPKKSVISDDESPVTESEEILLVAEITSQSSIARDRVVKPTSYAKAGIPIYILVDRHDGDGMIKLHSEPDRNGFYADQRSAKFGERIWIPEPFEIELDTKELQSAL